MTENAHSIITDDDWITHNMRIRSNHAGNLVLLLSQKSFVVMLWLGRCFTIGNYVPSSTLSASKSRCVMKGNLSKASRFAEAASACRLMN